MVVGWFQVCRMLHVSGTFQGQPSWVGCSDVDLRLVARSGCADILRRLVLLLLQATPWTTPSCCSTPWPASSVPTPCAATPASLSTCRSAARQQRSSSSAWAHLHKRQQQQAHAQVLAGFPGRSSSSSTPAVRALQGPARLSVVNSICGGGHPSTRRPVQPCRVAAACPACSVV